MFIWAQLMVDELSKSVTHFEVKDGLKNLPRGLENTYTHLLRMRLKTSSREIALLQRVLSLAVVPFRSLSFKEANYFCALDALSSSPMDTDLEGHLIQDPQKTLKEICGDFIAPHNDDLRLAHFSLMEFLTRPKDQGLIQTLPFSESIKCSHIVTWVYAASNI
jgi:hypothetical protein